MINYDARIANDRSQKIISDGLEDGLSEDELKRKSREDDIKHNILKKRLLRKIQNSTVNVTVYTGAFSAFLISSTWVLNLILPEKWKWLSHDNQQELTSIVAIILSYTAGIFAKAGIKRDR
ncbi:hypothetical protein [Bombella favorum]|uniref:Holin of 3TMs, for gene-transfer release n=1 Tax=Bombella favorum TaxID=2039164 RepID=A0ABR5ZMD1_9PROT|nr:hypothetical protein [Bombella favorum]MBA5725486.1 hypothetical protein [Bombella favorum]